MIKQYMGAKKIILFSQYPQHSCCTSGSSFCDAYRWLDKQNNSDYQSKISVIDQWWDRADYTELWAMLIQRKFEEMKKEHDLKDEDIRIIYSAHSLPESTALKKAINTIGNSGLCEPNRESFTGKWVASPRCLGLAKQSWATKNEMALPIHSRCHR